MEYEKLIVKYNNGKRSIFLFVSVFSIIGYVIDYITFNQKYDITQKAYHILSLLIGLFALVLFLVQKKRSVVFVFSLVAYSSILNVVFSHIFYHSFYESQLGGASNILSRDVFFLLCFVALTGFISSKKHIIIQGLIIVLLIAFYQIYLKTPFFIENGPVYILATIGFCLVMFFFTSVVKYSLQNMAESYNKLLESNYELIAHREELETTLSLLQSAQEQLIRSEKMASLGVLAAGVAHEINNPLNFIQGGVYGIEQYFQDNLKERLNDLEPLVEGIKLGVKRSTDIVASLNHFSRQGVSDQDKCDIHSIIDSCLTMLHNQLKFRIAIIKNYTDERYLFIGNEGKLHQVFLNILANSSQAIEEKGSITITTDLENKQFIVSIRDTGCGISKENLLKVSDPFFTTKEAGKGVGLGLSIVYTIIGQHFGTIEYKSEMGKWTEVIVKLPVHD